MLTSGTVFRKFAIRRVWASLFIDDLEVKKFEITLVSQQKELFPIRDDHPSIMFELHSILPRAVAPLAATLLHAALKFAPMVGS